MAPSLVGQLTASPSTGRRHLDHGRFRADPPTNNQSLPSRELAHNAHRPRHQHRRRPTTGHQPRTGVVATGKASMVGDFECHPNLLLAGGRSFSSSQAYLQSLESALPFVGAASSPRRPPGHVHLLPPPQSAHALAVSTNPGEHDRLPPPYSATSTTATTGVPTSTSSAIFASPYRQPQQVYSSQMGLPSAASQLHGRQVSSPHPHFQQPPNNVNGPQVGSQTSRQQAAAAEAAPTQTQTQTQTPNSPIPHRQQFQQVSTCGGESARRAAGRIQAPPPPLLRNNPPAKSRNSCLSCADISIKWYIVVVALLGLICALIGTIVGAVHSAGRDYISLALLLTGVGLVLVAVSWIALRITVKTYKSSSSSPIPTGSGQASCSVATIGAGESCPRQPDSHAHVAHRPASGERERLYTVSAAAARAGAQPTMSARVHQFPHPCDHPHQPTVNGDDSTRNITGRLMARLRARLPRPLARMISPDGAGQQRLLSPHHHFCSNGELVAALLQPYQTALHPFAAMQLASQLAGGGPAHSLFPDLFAGTPSELASAGAYRPPPPSYAAACLQDQRVRAYLQEQQRLAAAPAVTPSISHHNHNNHHHLQELHQNHHHHHNHLCPLAGAESAPPPPAPPPSVVGESTSGNQQHRQANPNVATRNSVDETRFKSLQHSSGPNFVSTQNDLYQSTSAQAINSPDAHTGVVTVVEPAIGVGHGQTTPSSWAARHSSSPSFIV